METPESQKKDRADRNAILSAIRQMIVRGDLPPGALLPKRSELEQSFGASPLTIQRAVDHLRREGFVMVRPRVGTFVTANPPHLCHYALVFADSPRHDTKWRRFYRALSDQAAVVTQSSVRRVEVFYGVDIHEDNENYRLLLAMTRAHRFAGIVFANPIENYLGSPILSIPGVGRIAFGDGAPGVSAVNLDHVSFLDQAVGALASRGRKRLAVLANPRPGDYFRALTAAAARHQMEMRPIWTQLIHLDNAEAATNCVHLLMHEGQRVRPDAMLIADDNLVEYATAGLLAAGVGVPADLDVVAHCNFPWPAPSVLPFMRLGYDISDVFTRCLDALDHQRKTGVAEHVYVPACFDPHQH